MFQMGSIEGVIRHRKGSVYVPLEMELPEGYIFKAPCTFWPEKSLLLYASGSVLYAFNTRDSSLSYKFENQHITKAIRSISVDKNRSLVLVGSEDKILSVFDDSIKLLSKRQFGKKLVSIVALEKSILIADSFGDISVLPFTDPHDIEHKEGDLLCPFSHYSTITATHMNEEDDSLFTANKDGKIVRNSVPDVHNILNYYLGHTQSVSALVVITGETSGTILVSLSIDFNIIFWDVDSGEEMHRIDLTKVIEDAVPFHLAWDSVNKVLVLPCSHKLFFLYLSFNGKVSHVKTTSTSLNCTIQKCLVVPLEDSSKLYVVDSDGNLHTYIVKVPHKSTNDGEINLCEDCFVDLSSENSRAIPLNVAKHIM